MRAGLWFPMAAFAVLALGANGCATVAAKTDISKACGSAGEAPPGATADFSGEWEVTQKHASPSTVTIEQSGDRVTGRSRLDQMRGKSEGYVRGNTLHFSWEADKFRGTGRYIMCADGNAFYGPVKVGGVPVTLKHFGRRKGPAPGASDAGSGKAVVPAESIEDLLKNILEE